MANDIEGYVRSDRLQPAAERVFALPFESRQGMKATDIGVLQHILRVDALPDRGAQPSSDRGEQATPQGLEQLSEGLQVAVSGPLNEVSCSSLARHDRAHLSHLSLVALDGLADDRRFSGLSYPL